jgi:hypothetical protein
MRLQNRINLNGHEFIWPLVVSLTLSPIVAVLFSSIKMQQSDNLLPSFFSTDHLTWFYWSQSRFGNIDPLIAFPIQNIHANLVFQVLLRISSILFVTLWVAQLLASITQVRKEILAGAAILFLMIWAKFYTDGGDALVHGANAHPLALPFAVLAVCSLPLSMVGSESRLIKKCWAHLAAILFYFIAAWTSILVILWIPAFWAVHAIGTTYGRRWSLKTILRWLIPHICYLGVTGYFWMLVARSGGEDSGINFDQSVEALTGHAYIYRFMWLTVCLAILSLLLLRKLMSLLMNVIAICILSTIYVIAAFDHVLAYGFSPRYFSVPLFLSSLIPFLLIISFLVRKFELTRLWQMVATRTVILFSNLGRVMAAIALLSLFVLSTSKVGYGTGAADAIGFNNTGRVMSYSEFEKFESLANQQMIFVSGNYWDAWASVFELRMNGAHLLAITKKAEYQDNFDSLYTSEPVFGICIDSVEKCYGSTINAQLDGVQLKSTIDPEPLMILPNGLELRLMSVSAD